jgi:hypothetical protein
MPASRKWTKEEDDHLAALLDKGMRPTVIGKEIGRSVAAILQRKAILKQRRKDE